ncbi:MAG: AAA family ATPase, partial [Oscillospiraceae bacterium]|nr:AAA family ATPase [Oscillospiraceae bacterium]
MNNIINYEKYQIAITKVKLMQVATFQNIEFEPSYINFFYGNNGTGKSTIASEISKLQNQNITWDNGNSNYEFLVYNKNFVDYNVSDYGSLKGIYLLGEHNTEKQKEIDEKELTRKKLSAEYLDCKSTLESKESELYNFKSGFPKHCFDATKQIRPDFGGNKGDFYSSEKFFHKLKKVTKDLEYFEDLSSKYTFLPEDMEHYNSQGMDEKSKRKFIQNRFYEKLKKDYVTLFKEELNWQNTLTLINFSQLNFYENATLLSEIIETTGNNAYGVFYKQLQNSDWVKQGLDNYHEDLDGKCPFCMSKINEKTLNLIKECFDDIYSQKINSLKNFSQEYENYIRTLINTLKSNWNCTFSKLDWELYNSKIQLAEKTFENNMQIINSKIKEPSKQIQLQSLQPLLHEVNSIIIAFNSEITKNNDMFKHQGDLIKDLWDDIWAYIASYLQEDILKYNNKISSLENQISNYKTELYNIGTKGKEVNEIIKELKKGLISIERPIEYMNNILQESGFEGFNLEVGEDKKTYKVIRPNDKKNPAKGLSEGERNFISFLYFYFTVKGIQSNNGELPKNSMRDKIIIIDDPVSSMDSSVLFTVSSLIRELIEDCFNEGKKYQIKQTFIFTHNSYFYLDIINEWTNNYKKVSLFSVKKDHNISTVNLCVREINNEHQKF